MLGLSIAWRAQLEKFVTRLYLVADSPRPQILVFLASETGNSCNSVCAHSSDLLASRVSVPVCLLEANPNVTSLQERLALTHRKGLADLVENPDLEVKRVASQVPGGELWLLTGGFPLPPGESLVKSERLVDRMNELRTCFDFVLIDAPPIGSSGDALILAQLADAAVLVLPAVGAHRESTRRVKEELETAGVMLLGAVLVHKPSSYPSTLFENKRPANESSS